MQSPHRPSLLRKMNVRKVLEVIQSQGTLTRADVMRCSGISAPTVSKAVSALLEAGLLEERETAEFSVGRPGKLLQLPRFTGTIARRLNWRASPRKHPILKEASSTSGTERSTVWLPNVPTT